MRDTQNPSPNCDEKNPSTIRSAGKDSERSDCNIRTVCHERNFVQIENSTAQDSRLSWEARGLMLYLMSLPKNWKIKVSHLQAQGNAGRDVIRRLLRELQGFGYVSGFGRPDDRADAGRFDRSEIVIYETPALNPFFLANSPTPETPTPETPTPETPTPENTSAYKVHSVQKTDEQITEQQQPVVVVGSKFTLEQCEQYAQHLHDSQQGVKNPAGFARTIHRTGQQDAQLESFFHPAQAAPVAAPLANPDPTCSLCLGTGREHVFGDGGRVLGVKPTPCSCRQPERARAQQAA